MRVTHTPLAAPRLLASRTESVLDNSICRKDDRRHLPAVAALHPMPFAPTELKGAPAGRLHLCGAAALRKN